LDVNKLLVELDEGVKLEAQGWRFLR